MKIHYLIESEQEGAEREAVMDCELYRGTADPIETYDMVRIPIRTDRRPRNAEHSAQIIFNAFFEMAHGVKDVRTRAMFCSSSWLDASAYTSGSDSYGAGAVLRVYPLKTAKAALIRDSRDSLDFIEGIGIQFVRSLKELFSRDEDMKRLTVVSQKVVHALNNGPVDNCLEQVNAALDAVKAVCTEEELPKIEAIIQKGTSQVSMFAVVPAEKIAWAIGNSTSEVMIFDAPYFYGKIQKGDRWPDLDDETISGQDVDDDGIPL